MAQRKKAEYEGWSNWETWNVNLLIDNEERTSNLARQMANVALEKRNRGQLNLDELAKQYARSFAFQERQVKKYHADQAADARDERGKYEAQQLQGKPGLTKEEVAALPSEERVKHIGDSLQGIFFDMGGSSDWEKPMEPVNWKEIATHYLDIEAREQGYQSKNEEPEMDPFTEQDKAEMKAMGITGRKRAMITSDTQLETVKPVPAGEAPKDDIAVNSHPANGTEGGAPVLDGQLHHTERPNVNAMREAIETQSEMEVGKPVETKQEEVKEEESQGVTVEKVDKGTGTQIIINIAGKKKEMTFSNLATAHAFIKGASAKFGDKFSVLIRPDQCPKCGSINEFTAYKDGKRYNPFIKGQGLWDTNKCDKCGHEWPFRIISMAPQQDANNNAPITSGISDMNAGGPNLKGAATKTAKNCTICGKPVELSPSAVERAKRHGGNPSDYTNIFDTHSDCALEKRKKDTSDLMTRQREEAEAKKVVLKSSRSEDKVYMTDNPEEPGVDASFLDSYYKQNYPALWNAWQVAGTHDQNELRQIVKDHSLSIDPATADKVKAAKYILDWHKGNVGGHIASQTYKGWNIKYYPEGSNHWKANRYGVSLSARSEKELKEMIDKKKEAGFSFAPPQIGSQVLVQFYPEVMHEISEYPNAGNAPMPAEMTGDAFEVEPGPLDDAVDSAFEGLSVVGYVSTSPAGGMGIGRDGKSQVLEGAPLRKENDIRGPMFTDEFYANYTEVPGAALNVIAKKVAAAEEKQQFSLFLKKVMGEVAATFIAAFKCTSRMPLNKVPGIGEIQLAQVEQPSNMSSFNLVNTGSRVKYLLDKLTDSEIQDAINDAWAQAAVWHDAKEGGYVYEVFVRAETIDTDSMIMKYKFVTGTKEGE